MSRDISHIADTIEQIKEIDELIADLNSRRDLLKADVIAALADETQGTIDGKVVVTHTTYTQSRFDTTAFKAALPDVAQRYMKHSEVTRFVIVKPQADQ